MKRLATGLRSVWLRLSPTVRYALLGGLFGCAFPLGALWISALEMGKPLNLLTISLVHGQSLLQWIIDTAPLVLAAFAYMAGLRQEQVMELDRRLTRLVDEREALIDHMKDASARKEQDLQRSLLQLRAAAQIAAQANAASVARLSTQPGKENSSPVSDLLNQVAHLISEQFNYYHVGIFLTGETGERLVNQQFAATREGDVWSNYAILVASNSPGGQRMLQHGHRLRIGFTGGQGIVGYVAAQGQPRIALDVGMEAVYFDNPELPDTRSEMALPMKIAGKTIGVLDIQSTQAAAFKGEEITVMSLIADSLSSAIENARLVSDLQESLEEVRSLNQQNVQQTWEQALIQKGDLEYTTGAQQPAVENQPVGSAPKEQVRKLAVPIRLRDQVIGEISLEAGPREQAASGLILAGEDWLPEELVLVEAVADQAALALENARLLAETRQRAERERITSSIAAKVWTFSDVDTILRTALQELGENLQASQGLIQLKVETGVARLDEKSPPDGKNLTGEDWNASR
jgi:GAF domain-containing protein